MQFRFYPLRFEFLARDGIHFPPGKAANILRGALGLILQRQDPLAYVTLFQPPPAAPAGFVDPPRPFVFRARHLDGVTLEPSQSFYFDLHLFMLEPEARASFVRAFTALGEEGLGPRRGKAELQGVRRVAAGDFPEMDLSSATSIGPVALDLEPVAGTPEKIRVDFLSPTELKYGENIVDRPEFPILFARIRDRISTLSSLYGAGPLTIDFRAMGARSEGVRTTKCEVGRQEFTRRSTRTGQSHSIGGFTGFAEYEGDLAEFLPYLEAARWAGVGRQAVWGKGEISVDACR